MFSLWHDRCGDGGAAPRTANCEPMPSVLDAILAFALALVVVWIATPVVKALAWRIGAIDEPRERGLHQFPTPRLGGLAILAGVVAAGLVFLPSDQQTTGILAGATVIVAVGIADDLLDLSADVKLAGQVLAAVVPVAAGVRVETMTLPFLGHLDLGDALLPADGDRHRRGDEHRQLHRRRGRPRRGRVHDRRRHLRGDRAVARPQRGRRARDADRRARRSATCATASTRRRSSSATPDRTCSATCWPRSPCRAP